MMDGSKPSDMRERAQIRDLEEESSDLSLSILRMQKSERLEEACKRKDEHGCSQR
jgi:hypothetical protein